MRRAGSSSGTKKTAGSSRGGGCGNTCWEAPGLGAEQFEQRILAFCANWESQQSKYALNYYLPHLIRAKDNKALYGLIGKSWIEARSEGGTYADPADDTRQVIEIASAENPPNIIQEVRHSLIYANLGSFTTSLLPDAFQLLAQLGADEQARSLAALLPDDQSRVTAEIAIGRGLLARGERDIARSTLKQALRRAERQHLPDLAAGLGQLGNVDDVRAAIDRLGHEDQRTGALAACARALAADGQLEPALGFAAAVADDITRIPVLADIAQESVKAGADEDAINVSRNALSLAKALADGPRAHAYALVARALARAGAMDLAADAATKSLADLASSRTDWGSLETICVLAQALAPSGHVEDVGNAAAQIAQAAATQAATDAPTQPGVPATPVTDGGPEDRHPPDDDGDRLGPDATDYERALDVKRQVLTAGRSVKAEGLSFRNLVSPVPPVGRIVLGNVANAGEIRANALSWVAQSLAMKSGTTGPGTMRSPVGAPSRTPFWRPSMTSGRRRPPSTPWLRATSRCCWPERETPRERPRWPRKSSTLSPPRPPI